jgi:hypothetical protein
VDLGASIDSPIYNIVEAAVNQIFKGTAMLTVFLNSNPNLKTLKAAYHLSWERYIRLSKSTKWPFVLKTALNAMTAIVSAGASFGASARDFSQVGQFDDTLFRVATDDHGPIRQLLELGASPLSGEGRSILAAIRSEKALAFELLFSKDLEGLMISACLAEVKGKWAEEPSHEVMISDHIAEFKTTAVSITLARRRIALTKITETILQRGVDPRILMSTLADILESDWTDITRNRSISSSDSTLANLLVKYGAGSCKNDALMMRILYHGCCLGEFAMVSALLGQGTPLRDRAEVLKMVITFQPATDEIVLESITRLIPMVTKLDEEHSTSFFDLVQFFFYHKPSRPRSFSKLLSQYGILARSLLVQGDGCESTLALALTHHDGIESQYIRSIIHSTGKINSVSRLLPV